VIEIKEKLTATLNRSAERLREAGLPENLAATMEQLAEQVRERCVVAVVGQVKVGKSTFVNALLGRDLAKVGNTETTATINYFSHGRPPNPKRPVRCHWRGGKTSYEDRAFLDGLQGNDIETLRRADGIDRLEYFIEHPFLEQVTLVDTPGTNAVVDEHQDATAEFMQLHDQLRERHNEDTRRLGREADAVIYLTGAVARAIDERFLKEFKEMTDNRSSPRNAIGVMSKIETQQQILAQRRELSADIAGKLKDKLNTVIPAGAGVERALEGLLADERAGLRWLVGVLRRIEPEDLNFLLSMDSIFFEYEDCPVSVAERRKLLEQLPEDARRWPIFTTIARVAADRNLGLEEVEAELKDISNFEFLRKTLKNHFIERGHILRWHRIVTDAEKAVDEIMFTHIPQRKKDAWQGNDRLSRFLSLVRQSGGDPTTMADLEDFIRKNLDAKEQVSGLEELYRELSKEFGEFSRDLAGYNADFGALQKLEEPDHGFSEAEFDELQALLGLRGPEIEKRLPPDGLNPAYVQNRAFYWQEKMQRASFRSNRSAIAEQAYNRCTSLLASFMQRQAG
jgi:predicted GTPase